MRVSLVCLNLHSLHVWCLQRPEEDTGFHAIKVTGVYEPPCGSWEPDLGPLQEQQVLLTTESSLQPPEIVFFEKPLPFY